MIAFALLLLGGIEADPSFAQGRKLYDQLEYEQAVFRFEEVATRSALAPKDRAQALLWLGLSYAGSGNFDAAKTAFSDAARNDASITLPIEVSKKLAAMFDDAKQQGIARAAADARQVAAPPPTPAPTPTPAPAPPSSPPVLAYAGIGGGVLVIGVGVAAGALCGVSYGSAQDKTKFASDAKASLDQANLELTTAAILIPVGVAIGAASTYFAFTAP